MFTTECWCVTGESFMGMSFGSLRVKRGVALRCFLWKIKHIPGLNLDKILLFWPGGLQRALLVTQEYFKPLLTINAFRKSSVHVGCCLQGRPLCGHTLEI